MPVLLSPVPPDHPTFIGAPRCDDLDRLDADVAIVGVPYTVPYDLVSSRQYSSDAPATIRSESTRFVSFLPHYDFDFGGPIFAGRQVRVVDCGDVAMRPGAYDANAQATTEVIRAILDRDAVPIVLGGDHAVPIPVFRAYEARPPIFIVQLDAHIDWRDEREGVREGLSSPMRRASEMPWVCGMAQIGIRGAGSARQQEVNDALAYGSVIVTADELREIGVKGALERIPAAERYYVTFDADGLDPAIAPGVRSLAHGGLTYYEATKLLRGVVEKGSIAGFDIVEVAPTLDIGAATSYLAARLTLNMIGAMAHSGQIGVT